MGERDALVHHETFHLMEDGQVRRVRGLAPVHAPGRNDVHGRRLRLHRPDLRGRGLGAQQEFRVPRNRDVQGVLHRPCGVIRWDIERLEVVPVVLDLRPLHHAEAEAREDADHLALDERHRVQRAGAGATPGQGEVDTVGLEQGGVGIGLQRLATGVESTGELGADLVRPRADRAPVVLGKPTEGLLQLAERCLSPEDRDLGGIQFIERGGVRKRVASPRKLGVELVQHRGGVHGSASLARGFRAAGAARGR